MVGDAEERSSQHQPGCDLQVGERVLDVGCGTGWRVRVASRLVGPTGRAVGVDLSVQRVGLEAGLW